MLKNLINNLTFKLRLKYKKNKKNLKTTTIHSINNTKQQQQQQQRNLTRWRQQLSPASSGCGVDPQVQGEA